MQGTDPKTMTVSLPSVLDINEIMNRLPHRFPFLLVRLQRTRPQAASTRRPVIVGVADCAARALPAALPQVDRIIEYVPGKYAIGIKNVTARAPRSGWPPDTQPD